PGACRSAQAATATRAEPRLLRREARGAAARLGARRAQRQHPAARDVGGRSGAVGALARGLGSPSCAAAGRETTVVAGPRMAPERARAPCLEPRVAGAVAR